MIQQLDLFSGATEAPASARLTQVGGIFAQVALAAREQLAQRLEYGFLKYRCGGIDDLCAAEDVRSLYDEYPASWHFYCPSQPHTAACASLKKGYIERTGDAA